MSLLMASDRGLSIRRRFLHIKDNSSMLTKLSYGVPQGCVLGPILITVYMLALGTRSEKSNADDLHVQKEKQLLWKNLARLKTLETWMSFLAACEALVLGLICWTKARPPLRHRSPGFKGLICACKLLTHSKVIQIQVMKNSPFYYFGI